MEVEMHGNVIISPTQQFVGKFMQIRIFVLFTNTHSLKFILCICNLHFGQRDSEARTVRSISSKQSVYIICCET